MEIGNVNVRMSAVTLAVAAFFTILVLATFVITADRSILIWGIPTIILLFIIPLALNYMSQSQYADLIPVYEQEAKEVRIKTINENMLGKPVRIRGVVERSMFRFLNRPQYVVADKSGEISVKMFTSPQEDVKKGDVVEVLGLVIRRYVAAGEPVVNCVSIRKIKPQEK
jgi:Na+(H+)/acetate symporter ActP